MLARPVLFVLLGESEAVTGSDYASGARQDKTIPRSRVRVRTDKKASQHTCRAVAARQQKKQGKTAVAAASQVSAKEVSLGGTDCREKARDLGRSRMNLSVRVRQETRLYYYIRTRPARKVRKKRRKSCPWRQRKRRGLS
jgi:hypothetical protein